jgi:hypothetical protein
MKFWHGSVVENFGNSSEAKAEMKRLTFLICGLILVITILAAGCAHKVPPETEVVSSCVTCHTDQDTLQEVASPEPAAVKSEETSGEG